ncbi:MAG: S41 family peptidase [Bacteroidetes bacterium]|nr:S41 family peptidase [Bacteroidota bacterium]
MANESNPIRSTAAPWQPLAFAVVLLIGVLIGKTQTGSHEGTYGQSTERGRVVHILDRIERLYVDEVERDALEAIAVEAILDELDPHSIFFSAEELAAMAEPMEGNFEGIGVEFIIQDDTLMVVAVIPGGPSEKAGMRAGDRILSVDSVEISGSDLTNKKVMEWLKGPRNTTVLVGLDRPEGSNEMLLRRDRIPIHSVVASIPLNDQVGYIKVVRFAQNTAQEFEEAMQELDRAGAQSVVVDLRGNGGGYLNAVVPMVESFLQDNQLVVYTEGTHASKRTYAAGRDGPWKDWPLAVLIDESSASASEIFAGAIQDNDRGLVVGRRSFGKGMVQEEFDVAGTGALRLTVARFYTPSGRAIQKPYGGEVEYEDDYLARYERGELFHQDSIRVVDSLMYRTPGGREVHGGGGIAPDFFVPLDTARWTAFLTDLSWTGILRDAAFGFVDAHRIELETFATPVAFPPSMQERAVDYLLTEAASAGWEARDLGDSEHDQIAHRFMAQVIRNVFGEEAYHAHLAAEDPAVQKALELLKHVSHLVVVDGRLTLPSNSTLTNENI